MARKVYSVGFGSPDEDIVDISPRSRAALLDADIIIFAPQAFEVEYTFNRDYRRGGDEYYQGKKCLSEESSFNVVEDRAHWRRELEAAFEAGKTIFVFLTEIHEVYRDTGQKQYSGTGKNRQTTRMVGQIDNYQNLPFRLKTVTPSDGVEITPAPKTEWMNRYWRDFGGDTHYKVHIQGDFTHVVAKTKAGDRIVSAIIRAAGIILLLPNLEYPASAFILEGENEGQWSEEGKAWGKRLTAALLDVDAALREDSSVTPEPAWAQADEYALAAERRLRTNISKISTEQEKLAKEHEQLTDQLTQAGTLRWLMYEKGPRLETAIRFALDALGFSVSQFREGESEFDVVFTSSEGRFIGEAEGKDTKAINIDKLSQLERNIQEDFARDTVTEYAKGVLFGNAYRFDPIEERGDFFTAKCASGARRAKIALVRTPDVFKIARYVTENNDPEFAKLCRIAIQKAEGEVVVFPAVPATEEGNSVPSAMAEVSQKSS